MPNGDIKSPLPSTDGVACGGTALFDVTRFVDVAGVCLQSPSFSSP